MSEVDLDYLREVLVPELEKKLKRYKDKYGHSSIYGDKLVSVSVPKEIETKLEHLVDACFELVFSGEWDQDNLQNHIEKNNEE